MNEFDNFQSGRGSQLSDSSRFSGKNLDNILDSAQVGVWEWDVKTGETTINRRWATMLGYTPEQLEPVTFQSFAELVHEDDLPSLHNALDEHLEGRTEYFVFRFRMRAADNSWHWIKARGQVSERGDDGRPRRMTGIHLDVSQLMGLVEVETQVNQRLDSILQSSPAVIYAATADSPHRIRYLSPNAAELFSTPVEVLTERGGWMHALHADDSESVWNAFVAWLAADTQEPLRQRYRIVRENDQILWLEDICRKVIEKGRVTELVGSVADVSDAVSKEVLLQNVVNIVPGVIYQFRRAASGEYSFPYASRKMLEIYGVTPEQARSDASGVFERIHPDDLAKVSRSIEHSAENLQQWSLDYRMQMPTGERWLHGDALPVSEPDGAVSWYGMIMDITKQKRIEQDLTEAKQRLERAQRIARIGHWEADMGSGELYWSDIIYDIFGFDAGTTTPSIELFANCVHPEDLDAVRASERRAEVTGIHDVEHRIVRPDGAILWVHELAHRERTADGRDVLYGTVRDITDTKVLELELRQLSTTDALTQVSNRRYFMQAGSQALERARRQNKPLAVLMLDLDHFKKINDNYGHAKGDEVLIRVAALMRKRVRQSDTLARLGGEEFCILLESCSLDYAEDLAWQLRDAIAELRFTGNNGDAFQMTCSIGVTGYLPGESLDSVMSRADSCLYVAKRDGRNRVVSVGPQG